MARAIAIHSSSEASGLRTTIRRCSSVSSVFARCSGQQMTDVVTFCPVVSPNARMRAGMSYPTPNTNTCSVTATPLLGDL